MVTTAVTNVPDNSRKYYLKNTKYTFSRKSVQWDPRNVTDRYKWRSQQPLFVIVLRTRITWQAATEQGHALRIKRRGAHGCIVTKQMADRFMHCTVQGHEKFVTANRSTRSLPGIWLLSLLPYILVTVCTDIVTMRIWIAYSNCTAILAHRTDSCGYRTYW